MVNTMTGLATREIRNTRPFSVPKRFKNRKEAGVEIYINAHVNFIRALAKKFTATSEEAEAAANEIFTDIWLFAKRSGGVRSTEDLLSSLIAKRRLIRFLQ